MRHFARAYNGDDIFWVQIIDLGMERMYFETSLNFDLHGFPNVYKLIRIVTNKEISERAREMFIQRLFFEIFKIQGIQKHYFRKDELDKFGQYMGNA